MSILPIGRRWGLIKIEKLFTSPSLFLICHTIEYDFVKYIFVNFDVQTNFLGQIKTFNLQARVGYVSTNASTECTAVVFKDQDRRTRGLFV